MRTVIGCASRRCNGGSAEDNSFAKATPSGEVTLQVDNPDVRGVFKPGDTYYLDFTKVE